ncbi:MULTISPECIES: serine/threonine-protein kinase [Limnospira]|uniref:Serine/threonine-protein kinase B n=1 Tax=Limnospira indica PCC 8005 TaxID=376219 RepID=A0A9P1KEZ7_9CYAN|nr:serine/threonine-protein kinase [Limnospira indica]CDM94927.1 Serine/threonine-protein kinase B [Limnospira indica PCC 8005]
MSYCTNPSCPNPENPNEAVKCQACGSRLRLRNRYLVVKPIGKGGFGATFLARDLSLPGYPACVVKQLRPSATSKKVLEMAQQLFQREAKTLGKIGDHPQIPRLLDYFVGKKQFYLVQEFVDGLTLKQEVRANGPLTEAQTQEFLRDILPLLDYIHSQEVIHRDIKPANIIRRRQDNRLVLIDFGAVKDKVNQATMMGTGETAFTNFAIGTSGFAPMEQMSLRPVYASDIYAVGMTCIYLLTGKSPSALEHNPTTGEVHWREHTHVSDAFGLVLERMLAVSVYQRYQSAKDVLYALDHQDDAEDDLSANMSVQPIVTEFTPEPKPEPPEEQTIYNDDKTSIMMTAPQREVKLIRERRERKKRQEMTEISTPKRPVRGGLSATRGAPVTAIHSDGLSQKTVTSTSHNWNENNFRSAFSQGHRDFGDCELSGLNLSGGKWRGANFYQARLSNINFQNADLRDANFGRARLTQAKLKNANLENAYLSTANLEKADLRGANLQGAYLTRANLRGANLCGANLRGCIVGDEQLALARTNWRTILPNGKRKFCLW